MKIRLAVAMSEDNTCFVQGNHFDDEERVMSRCVRDLELTGRVANREFYVDVDIPLPVVTVAKAVESKHTKHRNNYGG